ncbi:enoyl-CoA hydratase-related protein [Pseudonocardia kunmingensis]|uniref:Enoyl-CoA hydratase/carnithine racemase n=1 Tax=Pseudonocardia kunmingensis TaxID=630975 RepID=A0A543D0V4_9PSEU|nr:enoyl-CoA hydratase-related protein [Pseudonocardia kunmingensis]TQM02808.1 enoyl-CoA hydratase/carnithine racemase [Pseudonocardia kunmingensis]
MTTGTTEFTEITYAVADRIAVVTLHRPDRLNAFTPVMRAELVAAMDRADADDDVRAVVVTGAGRGFCAGADLGAKGDAPFSYAGHRRAAGATSSDDTIDGLPRDGGGVVSLRVAAMAKPVIAAINGAAIGVGITMTLPMDVRIAAEDAKFGFVFARRGIAPEAASSWFLPRLVGISQAMRWTMTGSVFGSDEALRAGLVSEVVPTADVLDRALAVAREVAENTSGVSVAATRRLLWSMLGEASPWEAHRLETHVIAALKQGPDAAEGVAAFLEKRPAAFTARVPHDLPDRVPSWPDRPDRTVHPN